MPRAVADLLRRRNSRLIFLPCGFIRADVIEVHHVERERGDMEFVVMTAEAVLAENGAADRTPAEVGEDACWCAA
jgi:hypothetical protein